MEYVFIVLAFIALLGCLIVVIRKLSGVKTDFLVIRMELEALLKSNREMGEALERLRSARGDDSSDGCRGGSVYGETECPESLTVVRDETTTERIGGFTCGGVSESAHVDRTHSETAMPEAVAGMPTVLDGDKVAKHARYCPTKKETRTSRKINYERFIGENLLGKIGILVLVIGVGLFIKYYALEQKWFSQTLRTVLSFALGGGLLGLSFRLRRRYRAFSSVLAGGGFAVFYVTVAVAFHYYGIFSQSAAFVMLVAFTVGMAMLAHIYDRRELAVVALVGGLFSPFLVSTGTGSYGVLFTYLTVLNIGMFVLVLRKRWGELTAVCFAGTWLSMLIYRMNAGGVGDLDPRPVHLMLFAIGFYTIFVLSVFVLMRSSGRSRMSRVLVMVSVLNNFIFAAFGIFFIGEAARSYGLSENLQGLCTLWVALVSGAICSVSPSEGKGSDLHRLSMAMAVLFAVLSVPVGMDGHLITVFWAVEAAVAAWLCMRMGSRLMGIFATVLVPVALIAYLFDAVDASFVSRYGDTIFLNPLFVGGAVVSVSLFLFSRFMRRSGCFGAGMRPLWVGVLILSIALCLQVFVLEFVTMIAAPVIRLMLVPVAFAVAASAVELGYRRSLFDGRANIAALLLPLAVITSLCWVSALREYPPVGYPAGNLLQWVAVASTAFVLWLTVRLSRRRPVFFVVAVSLMFTAVMVAAASILVCQLSVGDESSAAFSVSLVVSGFVLMWIGMIRHIKAVRMVSLGLFAIVVYKLFVSDIWLMPTMGKVLTFVLSGVALLLLSFLYQKLKSALFDPEERSGSVPEVGHEGVRDEKNGK